MKTLDYFQIFLFISLVIGLTPVIGKFMYKVFTGEKHIMHPVFAWLEKLTYKLIKVNPNDWKRCMILNPVKFLC